MSEGIQIPFTIVFSFKERGKTLEGYTKYDLIIRERTSEFGSTIRNLPIMFPDYLVEEIDKLFSTIPNNGDGMDIECA